MKNKLNDSSKNIDIQSSMNRYSTIAPSYNNSNDNSMKDNTFSIFKKESNNSIPQKNIPILPNTLQYSNIFNNNNNNNNNNSNNNINLNNKNNINNNNTQQVYRNINTNFKYDNVNNYNNNKNQGTEYYNNGDMNNSQQSMNNSLFLFLILL